MNRVELQDLANERLLDAQALLTTSRWSGAYYLAGYAVECALKACVLHYVQQTGIIFQDRQYLKSLVEKGWTHQLVTLVELAGLKAELGIAIGKNPALAGFWGFVRDWKETSRYEKKSEAEARELLEAISHEPDGVLRWIRQYW